MVENTLMKKRVLYIGLILLLINCASASNYYVKNGGNDNADGLSDETAWSTISKVKSFNFQPGDMILFKRGSSWSDTLTLSRSGSSGNPIIIKDYGTGNYPGFTGSTGILSQDIDYITVDSLRFTGFSYAGISLIDSSEWVIRNSVFENAAGMGIRINPKVNGGGCNNIDVIKSTFSHVDNGIYTSYWSSGGTAIDRLDGLFVDDSVFDHVRNGLQFWVQKGDATIDQPYDYYYSDMHQRGRRTRNVQLINNNFSDTTGYAFDLNVWGGENLVSGNRLINIGSGSANINAMQIGHSDNLIIENNYINGVRSGSTGDGHAIILDHNPRGSTENDCDGVIVRGNYITNVFTPGGYPSAIKIWDAKNSKIYNNILVNNYQGFSCSKSGNTGNLFYGNTIVGSETNSVQFNNEFPSSVWKNNILVGGDYAFNVIQGAAYPTEDHNLYFDNAWTNGNQLKDGTSIYADPEFFNSQNDDFRLAQGSPAVDAGTAVGSEYNTDYFGTPRPQGPGWDIGAIEYRTSTPTYSCTGSIASNAAAFDSEESTGLTANTPWTYSATDTTTKCQYHCISAYTWSGSACIVSTGSLIAHYTFDETSGTIATDSSGNGNTGTLINGPAWTTGQIGNALSFDGSDDYVDAGNINLDEFTLSAWIKLNSVKDYTIIGKSYGTYQFNTDYSGGLLLQRNSATPINYNAGLSTGRWYHVAATFSASSGSILYLNGVSVSSNIGDTAPTGQSSVITKIGAKGSTPSNFFNGSIDDVRIYNHALSTTEVQNLYSQGAGSSCGPADLPPHNNVIDINELICYINRWKDGDVGISDMMDAIGNWKDGC